MPKDATGPIDAARPWLYTAAGLALAALFMPGLLRYFGLGRLAAKGAKASASAAVARALKK